METEGFRILCDGDRWKRGFANFAFPKWTEKVVCHFHISQMDGNGGLLILHFRNGRKRRFADFVFPKWTETEIPFLSQMEMEFPFPSISIKHIFRFPFSVSGSRVLTRQAEGTHLMGRGRSPDGQRALMQWAEGTHTMGGPTLPARWAG